MTFFQAIQSCTMLVMLLLASLFVPAAWHGAVWAEDSATRNEKKSDSNSSASKTDSKPSRELKMASWYHPEADQSAKEKSKQSQRVKEAFKELQAIPMEDTDKRIETALEILRNFSPPVHPPLTLANMKNPPPDPDGEPWAAAMRTLIEIGKPAVPKLTAELDGTNRYPTMQALGFVLRGIGDPRAVPALLRAIPRMLQNPAQYEFQDWIHVRKNPDLLKFIQKFDEVDHVKHAERGWEQDKVFIFGGFKPEIISALRKFTDEDQGWEEYRYVALRGEPYQQNLQRKVYLKYARARAEWWSKNWQKFVSQKSEAELDLIDRALEQYARDLTDLPIPKRTEIPCGPKVTVSGTPNYHLHHDVEFSVRAFDETPEGIKWVYQDFDKGPQKGKDAALKELAKLLKKQPCIIDLDTAHYVLPPEKLVGYSPGGEPREPSQELLDWAEKEGCHLVIYKVKPTGSDHPFIVAKPLNVKLWQLASDRFEGSMVNQYRLLDGRFENLENEIHDSKKIDLRAPWTYPLAHFDEKTSQYDDHVIPSFFFITKAGTCGAMELRRTDANLPQEAWFLRYIFEKVPKK